MTQLLDGYEATVAPAEYGKLFVVIVVIVVDVVVVIVVVVVLLLNRN